MREKGGGEKSQTVRGKCEIEWIKFVLKLIFNPFHTICVCVCRLTKPVIIFILMIDFVEIIIFYSAINYYFYQRNNS